MNDSVVVTLLSILVPIAMIAGIVGLLAWLVAQSQRKAARQRTHAIDIAAYYGFHIDPSMKPPPPQRFDLFRLGQGQRVTNQMWRPGTPDSVFDYAYTTRSGKNSTTHHRTCAILALPFDAPHTKIDTETTFSTLGRQLGIRDIETESIRFNEVFRVDGDDERFAIALLDSRAIDWLLNRTPMGPGSVTFEFWGPWMVCVASRLPIDRQFGFLDWARTVPGQFPSVLTSLYPVRNQHPGARW